LCQGHANKVFQRHDIVHRDVFVHLGDGASHGGGKGLRWGGGATIGLQPSGRYGSAKRGVRFGLPVIQESHSRMPSMPAYTPCRAEKRRRLILLP
jgi:hypothetical protein